MSEADYKQLVERVLQNVAGPTISTDTGLEAAQMAGQIAAQKEVEWAMDGGIAVLFNVVCQTGRESLRLNGW